MSAAAETPAPTTEPSRSGRLLGLVRKLIDYGRELVATIRQRTAAEPLFAMVRFGTTDLALIFTRIARGLLLADALEARVLRRAAHLDAGPRPGRARSAARAPAAPHAAEPMDPGLARVPTAAEIAAEVRRRPIGAVIGDICRDLGILPSHPLWRDVQRVMAEHGGAFARLAIEILRRVFTPPAPHSPALAAAVSRPPAGGTGPP